ncbi:hypothetical protein Tco_0322352 [Tanacetum coccineum]
MSNPANDDFSQHLSDGEESNHEVQSNTMEHYLEYIDNEVWKVIQNGHSKKRISVGKDGVVRVLSLVSQQRFKACEMERRQKIILLMRIHKEQREDCHGMDKAKRDKGSS